MHGDREREREEGGGERERELLSIKQPYAGLIVCALDIALRAILYLSANIKKAYIFCFSTLTPTPTHTHTHTQTETFSNFVKSFFYVLGPCWCVRLTGYTQEDRYWNLTLHVLHVKNTFFYFFTMILFSKYFPLRLMIINGMFFSLFFFSALVLVFGPLPVGFSKFPPYLLLPLRMRLFIKNDGEVFMFHVTL